MVATATGILACMMTAIVAGEFNPTIITNIVATTGETSSRSPTPTPTTPALVKTAERASCNPNKINIIGTVACETSKTERARTGGRVNPVKLTINPAIEA
jgi:hypothetical protein